MRLSVVHSLQKARIKINKFTVNTDSTGAREPEPPHGESGREHGELSVPVPIIFLIVICVHLIYENEK